MKSTHPRRTLEAKLLEVVTHHDRRTASRILDRVIEDLQDAQLIRADHAAFLKSGDKPIAAADVLAHLT